jgi:four helix bundle protein
LNHKSDIKDRTLDFGVSIIKLSKMFKELRIDKDVIDQVRRSGTSVGANVNEGKSSMSRKELVKFYSISLKSANETDFWFKLIKRGYDIQNEFLEILHKELNEIEKILATIIIKLKSND